MSLRNCWISYTRRSETLRIPCSSERNGSNSDWEAPLHLQYTHGLPAVLSNLTRLSSCSHPSCVTLCSSRPSSLLPRQINLRIADLAMTHTHRSDRVKWFHHQKSFKLTISLYTLTIPHYTLYFWILCVENPAAVAINLSLVNTVQNYTLLNLVYKRVYVIYGVI